MSGGLSKRRFEEIYQKGSRVQGELCRVIALPGSGKVGFATPRAVGNTPRRNRLKRQFRAAVNNVEIPSKLDFVIAVSAKAGQAPFDRIQSDLAKTILRTTERWANESESS